MTFDELYTRYSKLVFNLALHYVHTTEDAEEITQDVFLKIHEKRHQFAGQSEFSTWIYRITINQSLDFIKARKRKKRWDFFSSSAKEDAHEHIADFHHPGVLMEQREAIGRLMKNIDQLPDQQKTALILLKIEQRTQQETAEIMGLSAKAVESLFQRAKKNLEKIIQQNEGK